MEKIRLEHLLEILSEEIWLQNLRMENRRNPSLQERLELVEKLMKTAEVQGNRITFEGNGREEPEFLAYPYVLLEVIRRETETTWRITGFDCFDALHDYIYHTDCWQFQIFVRENHIYKKCSYTFQVKDAKGRTFATDIWGFRLSWGYPMGNCDYEREPYFEHRFMLQGLCEFHHEGDVFCAIVHSLDELMQFMEEKLFLMLEDNHYRKEEEWKGEVRFAGEVYSYVISISSEGAGYMLYDQEGTPYCMTRHAFVKNTFCEKIGDCQDCMEIFSLQTEVDVMEELCKNARLEN